MDRVLLNEDDIKTLFAWKDENKDYVRMIPAPLKSVEICLPNKIRIKGIRKDNWLDFYVYFKNERIGKYKLEVRTGVGLIPRKINSRMSKEDISDCLSCYCALMAYMVYEKPELVAAEPKEMTSEGSHKQYIPGNKNRPTYILRRRTEKLRGSLGGHHASPKGIFSVRGHYRQYKTGKTVWINEYKKGTGDKKDKTYKMGSAV